MNGLIGKILKFRKLIIILTVLITIILSYGITKLTISSDITKYLKPDDPVMILFNKLGDQYGGNLNLIVGITADDIISTPVLNLIKILTNEYKKVDGVETVTSLINIIDIKNTGYGLEVGNLIDENDIPDTKAELSQLKEYIFLKETYPGKIISKDGKSTIIICRLSPEADKIIIAEKIKEITEKYNGEYRIYYSGYPIQMLEMNRFLSRDLSILIPIVLIIIVAVLFFSFRTARGVFLPLLIVVISAGWTMGLMGYLNIPLTMVSNIIPVILLALGTAYGIHYLARYYEDITDESTKLEAIRKTSLHISIPIILTALTTIAGFLSFTGAYITAISEFGIFTACGVLFAMILTIGFLPAVLASMKAKKGKLNESKTHPFRVMMSAVSKIILKRKKLIIILGISIFIIAGTSIPRIETESAIVHYFPKKSLIREAEEEIIKNFGGAIPAQIVINSDIKNPFVLKRMLILEKYLKTIPHMVNPQSLSQLIAEMNEIINGRKTIPPSSDEVANLLFLLEGKDIMSQLVKPDYTQAVVNATYGSYRNKDIEEAIENINKFLKENINGNYVVIDTSNIKKEHREKLSEYIISQTAKLIWLDIHQYNDRESFTIKDIEKLIKDNNYYLKTPVPLDEQILKDAVSELTDYLMFEAPIIIENDRIIEGVIDDLIDLSSKKWAEENTIGEVLKRDIPPEYWENDPELINITAEALSLKLLNYQRTIGSSWLAEKLIKALGLRPEDNLKKILIDDLWNLSEPSYAVKSELANSIGISGKEQFNISSELSGMIMITSQLTKSLIKSQVQSIIIAVFIVFILLSLQFRSVKLGIIVLSPILLVIMINFGIMGYGGIPLDYATMLVGSILIGVGIDYAIHFSSRFMKELNKNSIEKSLHNTLTNTGVAVVSNAFMVAFGFFVLIAGTLIPVKREGCIIGVLMLISAFSALVFLPSLMVSLKRVINNKTRKLNHDEK